MHIPSSAQKNATYKTSLDEWHAKRVAALKKDDGWLNLAGLYWLDEGKNSFGSAADNKIVFPKNMAAHAGYFELKDSLVTIHVADGVTISSNNQPIKDALIFSNDTTPAPLLASGSLRWNIIQRSEKIGIRLRDLESVAVKNFKGVERFAADTTWRITAKLITSSTPKEIAITNVLGQTNLLKAAGTLVFTIHGQQYSLDALDEGNELFIIFADATNGKTTYPSGRFLYANKPDTNGITLLDFNKAYNPPCAFTAFATCPLPPRQNRLTIAVTAGEKNYGHHKKS